MKRILILFLAAALLVVGFVLLPSREEKEVDINSIMSTKEQAGTELNAAQEKLSSLSREGAVPFDVSQQLWVQKGGETVKLSLREYLVGVLLAEMPADFPMEALKAQAIASRTFALKQGEAGKHSFAHICASSSCCQGWADPAEYDSTAVLRVHQAVEQTDGLVLTYEGKLIDATFFSCSGGQTEAAVAVWGGEIPYLQSVDSPGEEDAAPYWDTLVLDGQQFSQCLLAAYPDANLSGSPMDWFGAVSYTDGGGVDTIFIGGVPIKGTSLRSLLGLRSTVFSVETSSDQITITTRGFGHRVGLSQYGAKAMAEKNCGFEEILLHYYQNTTIKRLLCETTEQPCAFY